MTPFRSRREGAYRKYRDIFALRQGVSGTLMMRPMNVVHGFSAIGCNWAKFQNCCSFISISVTLLSSTQVRSIVSRLRSGSVNIVSGRAFRTGFFLVSSGKVRLVAALRPGRPDSPTHAATYRGNMADAARRAHLAGGWLPRHVGDHDRADLRPSPSGLHAWRRSSDHRETASEHFRTGSKRFIGRFIGRTGSRSSEAAKKLMKSWWARELSDNLVISMRFGEGAGF